MIEKVFFDHYRAGANEVLFERDELVAAAKKLKINLPKNLGDVVYSVRYRTPMPAKILATQPEGYEWIIDGAGRSQYAFRLSKVSRIVPNPQSGHHQDTELNTRDHHRLCSVRRTSVAGQSKI
ncbi:MAG: hypothetical protein ABII82_18780 [Verrucomicrobiota bacterium]